MNIEDIKDRAIKHKIELHKFPEIGFQEFKTSQYIINELTNIGYIIERIAGTGILAYKKGTSSEVIAFRADMDGLKIKEETNLKYKSQMEGYMHACGHDGHCAILLGFAEYIYNVENINKGVLFIFQPAEESPGGAEVVVGEGIFNRYNITSVFGLHIYPEINQGKIGLRAGALTAQSGEFDIYIEGKSAHGAMPQKGNDALVTSAQLINAYQSIISRSMNPLDSCVINIGTIKGGEARNIIPEKILLEGTIRTFSQEVYKEIKKKMLTINSGLSQMFEVDIKIIFRDMYPPVINDKKLVDKILKSKLIEKIIEIEPMMIAEDFSYYQLEVPGIFFMLGARNDVLGHINPLHSSKFSFDNDVLLDGIRLFDEICKSMNVY